MKNEEITEKKDTVANTATTNLYDESGLFNGSTSENDEVKKEFEDWFKVKIQGIVKSYKLHDDGSLQLKFQEVVEKTIGTTTYEDYEDKSIRIRRDKAFTDSEAKAFLNKTVESIDVMEKAQYKKISDGNYDFSKVEKYYYSANNVKLIDKKIENDYQLSKIFEFKVINIVPALKYDQRKRTQTIDKTKSVLMYEVQNDTLKTLHKISVQDLPFVKAQELRNKDVIVLDLQQKGSNYFCSKIRLK
jgi:hypothetical protein